MKNVKVLVTRIYPENVVHLLKEAGFYVTEWDRDEPMSQGELIQQSKQHDVLFCTVTEKIDAKFLNDCSHLKMISQYAAGYDNIDIQEATKLGIPVGHTPNAMSQATADIAFGLMIATARNMFFSQNTILEDKWSFFKPKANLGLELKNKTLGIFGLGRIGIEMAKRCKGAFDMKIIYNNRQPNKNVPDFLEAEYVSFDQLLEQSDVLSLHCSLNEDTKEIFNKTAFDKMKSRSIFINTSRGAVHNEHDLIDALKSKQIWGVGLDVTNPEPMHKNNPLLFMENVIVLPHIGSGTIEAREEMGRLAAENIIEFYRNNRIPHLVNPEVFEGK